MASNSAVPDTAEANAGNKNMAREGLNALETRDGLSVASVRGANGNEMSLRVTASGPISVRSNNPKPAPARPDSNITDVPLGGISVPFIGSIKVHVRIAEPKKKSGG